jgi:hypothetical protein
LALFASQILVKLGTYVKGDEVSLWLVDNNLLDIFILFYIIKIVVAVSFIPQIKFKEIDFGTIAQIRTHRRLLRKVGLLYSLIFFRRKLEGLLPKHLLTQ